ncbi:DUF5719 family protein [Arcanobacterium hippocoleae]
MLAGITPRGIDFIKPSVSGNMLVIPGLYLPPAKSAADDSGKPLVDLSDGTDISTPDTPNIPPNMSDSSDSQSTQSDLVEPNFTANLRIANPNDTPREVSIYTVREGEAPTILPGGEKVRLTPGSVLDLSLDGLKSGGYTLQLAADGEITAGVQISSGIANAASDYAWIAAQNPITSGVAGFASGHGVLTVSTFENSTAKTGANADVNTGTAGKTVTGTWTAFDKNGQKLDSAQIRLSPQRAQTQTPAAPAAAAASIALPENTAFVHFSADFPVYAGVEVSEQLGETRLIDWIPLTAGISDAGEIAVNIKN